MLNTAHVTSDKISDEHIEKSYEQSLKEARKASETALRDDLARDRTHLANERTALSYSRTVLGLVGLAVVIFKFTPLYVGAPAGSITLVIALVIGIYGYKSFKATKKKILADGEKVN